MLVEATSELPPDVPDDVWCEEKPISLMIDLNNIKQPIQQLEAEIRAAGTWAKGVISEHLLGVWSIDIETAKRTIDVIT